MTPPTDLTLRPPRSPRIRLGGFAILARMLDKGRATIAKKNGEYIYNSPTDQHLVRFVGVPGNPGQAGAPSLPAYAATKGALDTLVKHWASALGPRGIRVNAVAPGVIATEMSRFTRTEGGRELTLSMQALKRIGEPSDVADVIAFLASDKSRWITGVSLPVDGGSKL